MPLLNVTYSRNCPGQYVADQSLWAALVSVLATLRIEKAKDHLGNEIDFDPEFTGGLSRCVVLGHMSLRDSDTF